METRANYLLVATFVLVIVAFSVSSAIWLLNVQLLPETRTYYDINFSGSVAGLKVGAPVSLSGIPIGSVRKIENDPEDPSRVVVRIEVRKDAAIGADSVASLDIVNLMLGDLSIGITAGTRSAPPLTTLPGHAYPLIYSQPSQLQSVTTLAAYLVQRTIEVSGTLIEMLNDENRQAISKGLQTAEQITARAVGQTANFGNTIDMGASMIANGRAQVIAFNTSLPKIAQGLDTANSDVNDMDAVIKEVGNWARDFDNALTATRRQQVAEYRNAMSDLEGVISDARNLVHRFARYIDGLQRDPHRTLFGETGVGGYRPR